MSTLLDSEEDDYARLMRLLAEEEDASGDDDNKINQEPVTSVVSELETSDQDLFQMLEGSCSVEVSPPIAQESSRSSPVLKRPDRGDCDRDRDEDNTDSRQRSRTESIPDGVSLEWEESDRGSLDQSGELISSSSQCVMFFADDITLVSRL